MSRFRTVVAGLAVSILLSAAGSAAAENLLRWGNADDAKTADPHSYSDIESDSVMQQIYDTLLALDSDMNVADHLAVAWKPLNPTTWEFELRQGVRFHDGTPLTAEDVVFSIRRAQAETSDVKDYLRSVVGVQAIDEHTVRFTTDGPDPLLWAHLARIRILSKGWAERHAVTVPADFRAGEITYASQHANGTGAFILEEFDRTGRIVMVRNPDWWGLESYPHNVDRIERIHVASIEEGVQALLDGKIDFLQEVPYRSRWLEQLEGAAGVKLVRARWFTTTYLVLDQGKAELRSSNIKGRNPFQDKRVRQALYQAIDIETLVDDMGGLATPATMLIPPGITGYFPELAKRPPYDPERARALLAEAGYPNGFGVTLDCPNAWSMFQEEKVCRALAEQFKAIGVDATVEFQATGPYVDKCENGKCDIFVQGASAMFDSQMILNEQFSSSGRFNFTGYANPKVDELIAAASREMVTYGRDVLLEKVWRIVNDDVVYIPLYHPTVVWAMREDLDLAADPWARPRFRQRDKETGVQPASGCRGCCSSASASSEPAAASRCERRLRNWKAPSPTSARIALAITSVGKTIWSKVLLRPASKMPTTPSRAERDDDDGHELGQRAQRLGRRAQLALAHDVLVEHELGDVADREGHDQQADPVHQIVDAGLAAEGAADQLPAARCHQR